MLVFLVSILWAQEQVILANKQSADLNISVHEKIFVEDGSLVKVIPFQGKYRVISKKVGSTRVFTAKQSWTVFSLTSDDYYFYNHLKSIIKDFRGVSLEWQNGCSVLKGRLLRWSDIEAIAEKIQGLKNTSCNNTYLNQIYIPSTFTNNITNLFLQQNLALPTISHEPFLKFYVKEESKKKFVERFKGYGFHFYADTSIIENTPNIETEIIVSEIRKKHMQQFGIQWPSSVDVEISKKSLEVLPFSWSAQAIEENGYGKILASPKILSVGGKEAEFLAGGEIPIRAMGYRKSEVLWKSYGILLKVLPRIDAMGRLQLKLSVEISTIDASQKVDGLPGFLTNRMSSEFIIRNNEVLILSGLLREDSAKSLQGLPGLSSIPILGRLFGSEDYRQNKTELVILVRPVVKNNVN